ncbi:MAG TPA: hypothetical protein VEG61_00770 [Candidatus Dormibacteraeota bacterium]|nr:hypothetical protein [Candidatus Dormibacteraeota bacterium]
MSKVRTIHVRDETKHRLDLLGRKGDTYDDIICKLINSYAKNFTINQ